MSRNRYARMVAAAICSLLAVCFAYADEPKCDWSAAEKIADGILAVEISRTEPRLMKGHAVRVDLSDKSLRFTSNGRDKDWGKPMPNIGSRTIRTRRMTVDGFMAEANAPVERGGRGLNMVLAFNSAPWRWIRNTTPYADLTGLNIADGEVIAESSGTNPPPLFVVWKDGAADIVRSIPKERMSDVWLAHSGFAIVLENGRQMFDVKGEEAKSGMLRPHPRTAIGLSADRRWLYVLLIDGRKRKVSLGADYCDLAQIMKWLGASDALNFDGGGSSALVEWDGASQRPRVRFQQTPPPRPCALCIGICCSEGEFRGWRGESASQPARLTLTSPADGAVVPLLTDGQKAFLDMTEAQRRETVKDRSKWKAMRKKAGFVPAKVRFSWSGGNPGALYTVEVRRLPDGKVHYSGRVKGTELMLDNFELARTYEWLVYTGEKGEVARGTFNTEARAPRIVRLDGVPNMRDFGGRIGLGGRWIRQGAIYRSSGLNNNANKEYKPEEVMKLYEEGRLLSDVPELSREAAASLKKKLDASKDRSKVKLGGLIKEWVPGTERLTDATRAFAKEQFGIRTDLDLRSDRECYMMKGSPLGPDVKWVHISFHGYSWMFSNEGKKSFAGCFKVLLDESNYPICFHCIAGADRTGSFAYALNALLGVNDADNMLDWEVTAFTSPPDYKLFDGMVARFMKYPGSTMTERVASYVKSLGFTDADIKKFRSIMFER